MRARAVVAVLVAALATYLILLTGRAVAFIADGRPVPVLLGIAVLVLPLLGGGLVVRELQFGRQTQHLASSLARQGRLPVDDLPRRPSGRVEAAAAQARFEQYRLAVQADPADPAAWFALSVGYDDCGDRRRARAAMRTAISRARATGAPAGRG